MTAFFTVSVFVLQLYLGALSAHSLPALLCLHPARQTRTALPYAAGAVRDAWGSCSINSDACVLCKQPRKHAALKAISQLQMPAHACPGIHHRVACGYALSRIA